MQDFLMINKNWIINKQIDTKNFNSLINSYLKEKIDISEKSTKGNYSEQYDLFKYKDELKVVIEEIKNHLKKIDNTVLYNLVAAWTVIGKENSYHTVHRHNQKVNHIATVLYLNVPKKNIHQSGDFYYFLNDNNNISHNRISPNEGTFIVMPIDLLHGAYPQPKGIRQTLNMDFEIIKKHG